MIAGTKHSLGKYDLEPASTRCELVPQELKRAEDANIKTEKLPGKPILPWQSPFVALVLSLKVQSHHTFGPP